MPSRRLILLTLLLTCFCLAAPAHAAPRPNIIIILCDDMGFSDLGCYGSEIHTPNLDSLAAGGLRFTQFYNTSRCCPSRTSLLTGLYAHQAGVGHMTDAGANKSDGYVGDLNEHCVTIAQVLKTAGYANYMVGKWHVTSNDRPNSPKFNWPLQRGFDRYYGTIIGAGSFYDPGMLCRDNTPISAFDDPQYHPPAGEPYYYTNALSDQAARFITEHHQQHSDQPFFFYVAYTAAHWPMQALDRDIAKYKGVYDGGYEPIRLARFKREKDLGLIDPKWDLSPQAGEWDKVKNKTWEARCMEVYAAMVDCMDQGVGRIVESLKSTGQLDNTLILFLQDNGGNLETIGRTGSLTRAAAPSLSPQNADFLETTDRPKRTRDGWPMLQGEGVLPGPADTYIAYGKSWANVSNTPFREYKHFVHEGGISTPLIACWPSHISRKGELEKQPGHLIDLMSTCADLAGATYPAQFNGKEILPTEGCSLVPALEGKPIDRRSPLYWEHEGNRAMRDGKWKLVAKFPAGKWELYDVEADRTEMHDLSGVDPDRTRAMAEQWENWGKRAHVLPWPWKPPYDTDRTLKGEAPPPAGRTQFELKQGDNLCAAEAPQAGGQLITIEAKVGKSADNGVIVAQGGLVEGYSLYIKSGHVNFAVRRQRELTVIAAKNPLPAGPFTLSASIAKDGAMSLSINGALAASGKAAGALTRTPGDGLQVGQDLHDPVGEYQTPFKFDGVIDGVTIRVGQ